jgi:thiol-disulfide isomerase/thioredoxin
MHKFIFLLFSVFSVNKSFTQTQYEVLKDYVDGGKILKGVVSKDILASDTSFKWYSQNLKPFTGSKEVTAAFAKQKDSIQLVIFFGTWCEDSHTILPKLFSFLGAAGFSDDRITLIGVDRNKKTISHITDAFNIINVPTIMVMKEGRELGRIVEYGRYGMIEKELAEIVDKN